MAKSSLRMSVVGDVDELNSWLGLCVADLSSQELVQTLELIQHRLFTLGADMAAPSSVPCPRVEESHVTELEEIMEGLMDELPPLEEFVLPGGGRAGAALHVARSVARRAERCAVALAEAETVNPQAVVFLNRLSDLLFVVARVANRREERPETLAQFSERKKKGS